MILGRPGKLAALDGWSTTSWLVGMIDSVARFEANGVVGYGLFEYMILGPYPRYGFQSFEDVAP